MSSFPVLTDSEEDGAKENEPRTSTPVKAPRKPKKETAPAKPVDQTKNPVVDQSRKTKAPAKKKGRPAQPSTPEPEYGPDFWIAKPDAPDDRIIFMNFIA